MSGRHGGTTLDRLKNSPIQHEEKELAGGGHRSVRQKVENSERTNKPRRLDTSPYFLLATAVLSGLFFDPAGSTMGGSTS